MKLKTRLNLLTGTILVTMTILMVVAGMFIIDEIILETNKRLLRLEITNALNQIRWSYNYLRRSRDLANQSRVNQSHASLFRYLKPRGFRKTGMLFVIAKPYRVTFQTVPTTQALLDEKSVAKMFRKKHGFMRLSFHGARHLAAFEVFPDWNWLIVQSVSVQEMYEKRTEYLMYVSVIAFGILCLGVAVSTIFVRRLVRRIERTLSCVQTVEQGDLSSRISPIVINDEIGALQRGLNSMIGTIEKRTRDQQKAQEALLESEEKYRSIFENSMEGIYQSSPEGHFLSVNPAMARILGYDSPAEVLQAYTDIRTQLYVNPNDRDTIQALFNGPGRAEAFETRMYRKDGETIWVSITAYIVRDEQGRPLYYEGILEDITEQKQALEALETEKKFIEGALDTHTDAFVVLDLSGRFLRWNKALTNVTGFSNRDITSLRPEDFFSNDRGEKAAASIQRIIDEGHASFETAIVTKEGTCLDYEFTGDLLKDLEGDPTNICIVGRDITDRKQAEKEIRRLNEELEQRVIERTAELEAANRELKDFAYVVSHDLKAPLRAINQLAGWIAEDFGEALGDEGNMQIDLLMGRVRRMHGLIEGILQYSRIGRVREKEREVDLDSLVREVIEFVSPPRAINVVVENRLPVVSGEPTRLNQLFQNLVDNAIKHMDKPDGEVVIGSLDEGNQWKFWVKDNGPGIAKKYFDKVFQIFQTLTPRDESENTGIGLALVKRIVEISGGRIWMESEINKGSTFFFTLPKRGMGK
jgi:two-component system sensor kinase FixL